MADEIRLPIQFAVNNAGFETTRVISGQSITQTTGGWLSGTQSTSTSQSSFSVGGLTKPGVAYFKNLSIAAGENVLIGTSTGQYDIQLNPDEAFVVRLNDATATIFYKSDAGTPSFEYLILED
jgi:hypothetical protein